jgi:hypothetical protein
MARRSRGAAFPLSFRGAPTYKILSKQHGAGRLRPMIRFGIASAPPHKSRRTRAAAQEPPHKSRRTRADSAWPSLAALPRNERMIA